MDYRNYINTIIDKKKRVLEIGPLNRTVISKKDYPNVFYADIRNTEEIKKLYTSNQYLEETNIKVDIDSIIDIDFVIKESYEKTFENVEKFDYVVASHVLEHIPDIIYFFQDIKKILKPNGNLIIFYPDKRYCFDHFRVESSFRDAYEIFINKNKSNPKMVFDFIFNVVKENDPCYYWDAKNLEEKPQIERFEKAEQAYKETINNKPNDDIHYWPFTDYGFLKFLSDLSVSNLLDFKLLEFYETQKNTQEFMLILKLNVKPDYNSFYNKKKLINPSYKISQMAKEKMIIEKKYHKELKIRQKNDKELKNKEEKIIVLESLLRDIYESNSWKITKPLRITKKLFNCLLKRNR